MGMYEVLTAQPPDLVAALYETWPHVAELLVDLEAEQRPEARVHRLRHIGAFWYAQGGAAEVLTELGLHLAPRLLMAQGQVVSELLLAFGAAQEEQRTREWEARLVARAAELNGLHQIISAANSTLDLDTSLQTVVETVAQVVGVEVCSVFLYDKHRDELVLRATRGLSRATIGQVVAPLGHGVTGWAAQLGQPVAVRDVWEESRFNVEPQLGEELFRSMLAVPIVLFNVERFQFSADKLQGVITIQTVGPRDFSQEEISFVEVAAGELAFFIANAQLYQQTDERLHQKVRELTTLQQVSKIIAEKIGLRDVLALITEKAVDLAQADRAAIFQMGDDGQLQLVASHGGDGDGVRDFIIQTVRDSRPLAIMNAFQDARFPDLAKVAQREGFHSLFCMPLRARERTIGGICLYKHEPHLFDYEQVRLLSTFADEAAIAIENARLYEESQRALAIKSALLQEMHHRVRNNLQTISALLAMQLRRVEAGSQGAKALRESAARIQSIAAIHNLLSREDVGVTTVSAVSRQVVESAQATLVSYETPVRFAIMGDEVRVGSRDATVLALVINELISNALSHGLAAEGGKVELDATLEAGRVTVEVRDDGPLHPPAPRSGHSSGLGLQIIETLVQEDLGGSFSLLRDDAAGWMRARITFPQRMVDALGESVLGEQMNR
ncbi:MAG: GAF domain-containing protein [Candidatus Viridilinea halotolerans]|uniref:histidine kinase n=1 Tax=Candidatus Viridilinea halotolerans TaxID=2491704 RepID=A0A426TTS7_9CHLR|nr:MAG: GAF domain-containing protein [Candidatus Viridilinea halotolerans]